MTEFIHEQFLEDIDICDLIIEYHNTNEYKGPGLVFGDNIRPEEKDSIDCQLRQEHFLFPVYLKNLQDVVKSYIEKYPMCDFYAPWGITEVVNVQYYKPTAGYHAWHTERCNHIPPSSTRHLVFMTYLNDVTDGGETEFYHQKIKIKPEKGKTVIWPADWTYTHRGIASPTQEKYIVTGWFNFCDR